MRFIIKVGNHEESEWMDELKKFKAEYNGDKVTIDLNSWPAFVELEKIFNDAPKVYPAFTYNTDISHFGYGTHQIIKRALKHVKMLKSIT